LIGSGWEERLVPWIDLLRFPLASLGHQKLRTCLTTLGVVFGAFVLAASLSIDEGVQRTIEREANKGDTLRKVTVSPGWRAAETAAADDVKVAGRMSPDRRERIRKILAERARQSRPGQVRVSLTQDRLEKLSCIAHVGRMIPLVGGMVVTTLGNRPEDASVSCGAGEDPEFRKRVIVGRSFDSDDEKSVLLSEMFAHRIGLVDDADLDQVLGKPLRIEIRGQEDGPSVSVMLSDRSKASGSPEEYAALRQLAWQIPGALDRFSLTAEESAALRKAIRRESAKVEPVVVADDFRVVGIFRELTDDERKEAWSQFPAESDLVLPRRTAVELMFRDPARREEGVDQAVLFVDEVRNVKEVVNTVKTLGMQSRSIVDFIERQSVLERRREIGIMKAVGAANWQLQALYVIEGGLIGLIGGSLGLLLAWSISLPGDAWVRSMVRRDMDIDLSGSIFAFPGWIGVTVLMITVGVTIVAAVYPARRAAKLDPVSALRHD
jgi:putative ABC transport system permease protein